MSCEIILEKPLEINCNENYSSAEVLKKILIVDKKCFIGDVEVGFIYHVSEDKIFIKSNGSVYPKETIITINISTCKIT